MEFTTALHDEVESQVFFNKEKEDATKTKAIIISKSHTEQRMMDEKTEREREREREDRQRQTDRQTDRQRESERGIKCGL